MTKRILWIAVVLFAATYCFAAEQKTESADTMKAIGTIEKVDIQARTIVLHVRQDGKEEKKVYAYNDHTAFWSGAAAIKPEDLKAGSRVSIEVDSSSQFVTKVEVQEKQKMKE